MKYFCDNLLYLKRKYGYTQEDLADKLMVSRQSISKLERGEAYPDIDNIILIANLYNVSLDDLMTKNLCDANNANDYNSIINEEKK